MKTESQLADQIYRAALDLAGRLGDEAPPGVDQLRSSMIAVLAERRLTAQPVADSDGLINVDHADGHEGVAMLEGLSPAQWDTEELLRQNDWRRIHQVTVARQTLRIQTLAR